MDVPDIGWVFEGFSAKVKYLIQKKVPRLALSPNNIGIPMDRLKIIFDK